MENRGSKEIAIVYLTLPWVAMTELKFVNVKFGKENIGFYRDDGLALIKIN